MDTAPAHTAQILPGPSDAAPEDKRNASKEPAERNDDRRIRLRIIAGNSARTRLALASASDGAAKGRIQLELSRVDAGNGCLAPKWMGWAKHSNPKEISKSLLDLYPYQA